MKTTAVFIERSGPPDVLVERSRELPEPGPGEVRLKVAAAGVNFADLLMRMGLYGTVPPKPYSPGFEVAGVVTQTGSAVKEWREGDRAVALMRYGGYARDLVLPDDQLFPWPEGLDAASAAGFPVVFLTAWVCLFSAAAAQAGERVLVLGGAGGVGTAAVQLARRAGLEVLATAGSPRKCAFVTQELGARACFESRSAWHREIESSEGLRSIDIVLDPVGGVNTKRCRQLLAPLGRLVFYGLSQAAPGQRRNWVRAIWAWLRTTRFHPADLIKPNIGIHGVHLLHLQAKSNVLRIAMDDIRPALEKGELKPIIDRTFPLTAQGAAEAHEYLHQRRNIGKVVLASGAE